MILGTTAQKLQVVLSAAKTANDCLWTAEYVDFTASTAGLPTPVHGATNGLTAVDMVAAPGGSTSRLIRSLILPNIDTAPITATINLYDTAPSTATYIQWYGALNVGDALYYSEQRGFYVEDSSGNLKTIATSSVSPGIGASCYRLSTATGIYEQTAAVAAAATLYAVPGRGKWEYIYDTTSLSWKAYAATQLSLSVAALTASTPYDIFEYVNSGALALSATAWTNISTRATALAYQDGVLTKSGAAGYRYLGTIYINAVGGQIDLVYGTTAAVGGSAPKCGIWNAYNRVRQAFSCIDSTVSWNYTTATWRQKNGSASNQFAFIIGVAGQGIVAVDSTVTSTTSTAARYNAIGYDTAAAISTSCVPGYANLTTATGLVANYFGNPAVGYHYLAEMEKSQATGTTTWYGGDLVDVQGGMLIMHEW